MKAAPLPPRPANSFVASFLRFDDDAYTNATRFPSHLTMDGDRHRVDTPPRLRHECEVFYEGHPVWTVDGTTFEADDWTVWCPVCERVWPFNFEAEARGFAAIHEQENA